MNTFKSFALILACSLHLAHAIAGEEMSKTLKGSSGEIKLEEWDNQKRAWKKISFINEKDTFQIYNPPFGTDITGGPINIISEFSKSISPDKKFSIIQRSEIGKLYLEDGTTRDTETSKCEIIDMKNGCVMQTRPSEYCSGTWTSESKWTSFIDKVSSSPTLETPSPGLIIKRIDGLNTVDDKSMSIQDSLYMGVKSYLACFQPSQENIRDLNNIAYFLAESGNNHQALEIYKALEAINPTRTVLKLNIADSLWDENRKPEAMKYYSKYIENMKNLGNTEKIPSRAYERTKH